MKARKTIKKRIMKRFHLALVLSGLVLAAMLSACQNNASNAGQDSNQLQKAAEKGDAEAQFCLGKRFFNGDGVEKDMAEAAKWWRMAAEQDMAEAQYNLGICYLNGDGVRQDKTEAVKWLRKAADQGSPSAKNILKQLKR